MTREQEISIMGAHAARPSRHRPTTVARVATTTLAVAVTGVLGAGTALAHDDGGHDGHGDQGSHDSHDAHGGHGSHDGSHEARAAIDEAHAESARAQDEAARAVQDALADLGMGASDPSAASDAPDDSDGSDTTGWSGEHTAEPAASAPAPAPAPRTTTQPIRASDNTPPASEVPAPGETETIPIR